MNISGVRFMSLPGREPPRSEPPVKLPSVSLQTKGSSRKSRTVPVFSVSPVCFGRLAGQEKKRLLDQLHHPDFMAREAALERLYDEPRITDPDILRTLARFSYFEDEFKAGSEIERIRTYSRLMGTKILEKNPSPWGMEGAIMGIREVGARPLRRYNGYLLKQHYPILPPWLQRQFRARLYSLVVSPPMGSADDEAVRVLKEFAPLTDVPLVWHLLTRQKAPGTGGLPDKAGIEKAAAEKLSRILLAILMREQPEALEKVLDIWKNGHPDLSDTARAGLGKTFQKLPDVVYETGMMQTIRPEALYAFLPRYEAEFVYNSDLNDDNVSEAFLPRYMDFKLSLLDRLPGKIREAELKKQAARTLETKHLNELGMLCAMLLAGKADVNDVVNSLKPFSHDVRIRLSDGPIPEFDISRGQRFRTVREMNDNWMRKYGPAIEAAARGDTRLMQPVLERLTKDLFIDVDQQVAHLFQLPPEELSQAVTELARQVKENPRDTRSETLLLNLAQGPDDVMSSWGLFKHVVDNARGREEQLDEWRRELNPALDKLMQGNLDGLADLKRLVSHKLADKLVQFRYFVNASPQFTSRQENVWRLPKAYWPILSSVPPLSERLRGYRFYPSKNPPVPKRLLPLPEPRSEAGQRRVQQAVYAINQAVERVKQLDKLDREHDGLPEQAAQNRRQLIQGVGRFVGQLRSSLQSGNDPVAAAIIRQCIEEPLVMSRFFREFPVSGWKSPETLVTLLDQIPKIPNGDVLFALGAAVDEVARQPGFQPYIGNLQQTLLRLAAGSNPEFSTTIGRFALKLMRHGVSPEILGSYKSIIAESIREYLRNTDYNPLASDFRLSLDNGWDRQVGLSTRYMGESKDGSDVQRRLDTRMLFDLALDLGDPSLADPLTRCLWNGYRTVREMPYADEHLIIGMLRRPEYLKMAVTMQDPERMNQLATMLTWYKVFEAVPVFLKAAAQQVKQRRQLADPVNLEAMALSLSRIGYLAYPEAKRLADNPGNIQEKQLAEQFIREIQTNDNAITYFSPFPVAVPFLNLPGVKSDTSPPVQPIESGRSDGMFSPHTRITSGHTGKTAIPVAPAFIQTVQAAAARLKSPRVDGPTRGETPAGEILSSTQPASPVVRPVNVYIPGLLGWMPDDPIPDMGEFSGVQTAFERYREASLSDKLRKLKTLAEAARRYNKAAQQGQVPFTNMPEKVALARNVGDALMDGEVPVSHKALLLETLAALAEQDVSQPAIRLLETPGLSESMMIQALSYLEETARTPDAIPCCREILVAPGATDAVKTAAVRTLSVIADPEVLMSLFEQAQALRLSEPVKQEILEAVSRTGYGDDAAVGWMLGHVGSALEESLQVAAAEAIRLMTDCEPPVLEALVSRVQPETPGSVKLAILNYLQGIPWTPVMSGFVRAMKRDPDPVVRQRANDMPQRIAVK